MDKQLDLRLKEAAQRTLLLTEDPRYAPLLRQAGDRKSVV